jgi:UDP-2,3-diacylglucosamine pyrophosphatase LpxH
MEGATDHLIVISDLHLGGRPARDGDAGFQICPPKSCRRLARFIRRLADDGSDVIPRGETVELVINGDFVDFLAEEPFLPFTSFSRDAVEKLKRVIRHTDEASEPGERVFPALAEFVGRGNKLTILLGNHDIELSLPAVRRALADVLTSGRPARLEFLFDGEAYVRGDVLIEHGNRYDGWNAIAYGALRAHRSSSSRGELPFEFQPPAGSRLVSSVMNQLKSKYRFVDLLKPENETAIPLLCALEPTLATELTKVAPLWLAMRGAKGKAGQVRREETYIASIPREKPPASVGYPTGSLEPADALDNPERERSRLATEEMLTGARQRLQEARLLEPLERVPADEMQIAQGKAARIFSHLGLANAILSGKIPERADLIARALHARSQAIATTFELGSNDPPYCIAAERLHACSEARIVLFGHTHLAKTIPIANGRGKYLNTGTWCPTIRIPAEFCQEDPSKEILENLGGFIKDLASNRLENWTTLQTIFAHIQISHDGQSRADLYEIDEDDRIAVLSGEKP